MNLVSDLNGDGFYNPMLKIFSKVSYAYFQKIWCVFINNQNRMLRVSGFYRKSSDNALPALNYAMHLGWRATTKSEVCIASAGGVF